MTGMQWKDEKHKAAGVRFHLGLVYLFLVLRVCICMCVCILWHLFENHELVQEVDALAGEEFPDGLLSLEALRVRGGAHLGRLVPQELRQRVVLHTEEKTIKKDTKREYVSS